MRFLALFFFFIITASLFWVQNSDAQIFTSDSGYVEFESSAPLLTFKGTSDNLNGFLNTDTNEVDFYVDLSTLDTGNRRRDRDMRQVYLEVERFPFAEFSGEIVTPWNPESNNPQTVSVEGSFTMREISRPFSAEGVITLVDGGYQIEASWEILLEDYNIDRPRIVFYELSDVQKIRIDINLKGE